MSIKVRNALVECSLMNLSNSQLRIEYIKIQPVEDQMMDQDVSLKISSLYHPIILQPYSQDTIYLSFTTNCEDEILCFAHIFFEDMDDYVLYVCKPTLTLSKPAESPQHPTILLKSVQEKLYKSILHYSQSLSKGITISQIHNILESHLPFHIIRYDSTTLYATNPALIIQFYPIKNTLHIHSPYTQIHEMLKNNINSWVSASEHEMTIRRKYFELGRIITLIKDFLQIDWSISEITVLLNRARKILFEISIHDAFLEPIQNIIKEKESTAQLSSKEHDQIQNYLINLEEEISPSF